ncbi:hypothetical protein BC834DRAFT_847049 [Gloeopeniophorella convolvens]|nr:hypothetical protein BC834DRAFT_847049 [Gloeopeniophorella convolvens]
MLHVNIVDDPLPIVPSLTQLAVGLMHHLEVHQARVEFSSGMLCVEVFAPSNDHDAEARFCILYNHGTPPLDFLMAATPAVCRSFAPALARVTKLVVQCGDFLTLGEDLLPEIAYTAGWDTILEFFPRATSLSVVCNERLDIVRALQESSDLSPLLPELEKLSFFVKGSSKYNSSAALFAEIQPLLDARGAAERPVKAYTREIPPDGVDAVLSCAPGQPPEIALN